MASPNPLRALDEVWRDTYYRRTARSRKANEAAEKFVAKGQRARFNSGMPYPVYIERGAGSHFTDLDGNDFLDCNAGWNAAFLGRGNPTVSATVQEAMAKLGAPGGAMHPSLIRDEFAELLCERVPGAERVIFAPSGSEANTYALRLARSFTGKQKVIRMAGGFHGQHDALLGAQSSKAGTASTAQDNVITVPFNDLDAARSALAEHAGSVAALITEPMMTIPGAVHQRDQFLAGLRAATRQHHVVFVLDEVITGCRFAVGGASEFYDFAAPDLTVMGKMLGGGLPTAAVVGRADIIEQPISASNTHAQNPVTLAAAVAAMRVTEADGYARVAKMGDRLRRELRAVTDELTTPVQVTGDGPCVGIHFVDEEVVDFATAERADHSLWQLLCLGIASHGLGLSSRTFGPTLAWTESDLDVAVKGFSSTLEAISTACASN
ncbi:aspartate aminotransferase family protein [Saccharopolyspora spinosa]|uniref:Glutamate-1-semialdehyde 2,1-aminomutase n=1 Tax=Saccharopolyspora spinosa TaxID=60894 RepID=Q6JHP8_SACSN|nr:aminotransferase class III-fold pyridoxal phosphate-dependent enzyme [Saccharopolyspora spinosa]AAS00409.1 glutamate-1-semialdehyde 2,1-aminotransferase [Saccharopolyspora spinosa NRRL 18395]PKW16129.1 glutamate-1-semialdehyde 2,1-aminomutase [Saccharopolyspora spinosa]